MISVKNNSSYKTMVAVLLIGLEWGVSVIAQPVAPIDLPKIGFYWRDLPDSVRIEIGREFVEQGYAKFWVACALSKTKVEQPDRCPDNNAIGLHPFRERYPWGWANYWKRSDVRPIGWYNAYEAMTGKLKPYLAFKTFYECVKFDLSVVMNRIITNGEVYNKRWVGRTGYNRRFDEHRDYFLMELNK